MKKFLIHPNLRTIKQRSNINCICKLGVPFALLSKKQISANQLSDWFMEIIEGNGDKQKDEGAVL